MNKYVAMGVIGLFLAGCGGGSKSYVKKGEIGQTLDQEAMSKKYFESIGIGAADPAIENTSQRRAMSRNAAIVAAQYEMLSMIKGVELEGGIRVEKAIETDSQLETRIKEVSRGAQIVKSEWTNDDGCLVTIRLDRKVAEEKMGVRFK